MKAKGLSLESQPLVEAGQDMPPADREERQLPAEANLNAVRKGEKHPNWNQNIKQIRPMITRVASGYSMRETSLEAGFSAGWLSNWKRQHPERYRLILAEETRRLERERDKKRLGNAVLTTVELRRDKLPVTRKQERPSASAKISTSKKGEKNPMYGKKHSAEARGKISAALKGENHPYYGKKLSAEHRAKISAANKGKKSPMAGKKHSAEARARLSAANKGKKLSAETKAKIGAAHKGKKVSAETRVKLSIANRNRKHSAEARAKMSVANRGEKNPNYGKKVSAETRAKISAARKKEKHSKTIERARSAIARVAAGHTMKAASLEAGFGAGWLSGWKERHPEQYRLILDEEANKLKQAGLHAVRESKKHPARIKAKTNAISNNEKQSNSDKISHQPVASDPGQKPEAPAKQQTIPRPAESLTPRQLLIRKIRRLTDELQDEDGLVSLSQLKTALDESVNGRVYSYGSDLHLLIEIICQRKDLLLIE